MLFFSVIYGSEYSSYRRIRRCRSRDRIAVGGNPTIVAAALAWHLFDNEGAGDLDRVRVVRSTFTGRIILRARKRIGSRPR